MKYYHGTLKKYAFSIIRNGIITDINLNNELDFGYGFYLGDKRYAINTAVYKAKEAKIADSSAEAAIIEFDVDLEGIKRDFPAGITFPFKSKKYLDYIFLSRYHKGIRFINLPYIIAPLADGNVDDVMTWYKEDPTKLRKFISYLRYWIPTFHMQLVVKDPRVCDYLTAVKIINEKGESLWEKS